jgi:hypothetical protein
VAVDFINKEILSNKTIFNALEDKANVDFDKLNHLIYQLNNNNDLLAIMQGKKYNKI